MASTISLADAAKAYPEYKFISALTPSAQKAAFHVQDRSGRDLCFKIILPGYDLDRLNREILALQAIKDPNVVRLVEYTNTTKDGAQRHYLVEEFIEGADLSLPVSGGKPGQRPTISRLFQQLCSGLQTLKKLEIVHRDLKPSNIRIRPNGNPVIIDFGVARHLTLPALTDTKDGAQLGTPIYFSPEQFTGTKHDIDHRTDLFAVGVMLFQALTGNHPFYADGMTKAQLQTVVASSEKFKDLPEFKALPAGWQLLGSKLLEKSRVNRPIDAETVKNILIKLEKI